MLHVNKLKDFCLTQQEVLQVFPEVVSQTVDGMYGVSYSDMVVPLIGAVKELSARLALLESQFAASQTPQ